MKSFKTYTQQLDEGMSSVVFHATSADNAIRIIESRSFIPGRPWGTVSYPQWDEEKYPYRVSFMRSLNSAFLKDEHFTEKYMPTILKLDGSRIPGKVIQKDYYGAQYGHSRGRGGANEIEDMIISKTKDPIRFPDGTITQVIMINPETPGPQFDNDRLGDYREEKLRLIKYVCELFNIPLVRVDSVNDLQNRKKYEVL